jgi:hypothetical protein
MRRIISLANLHEWVVETRGGKIPLAIIAFFSLSKKASAPTCDGFYQYTPETRTLDQWMNNQGQWLRKKLGVVTWLDEKTYRIDVN